MAGKTPDTFAISETISNIVFTPKDWPQQLEADLYLPERTGRVPVVMMVHGGGWSARSRDDMNGISRKLTHNGYAVLNVSYRFAPAFTYPAQIHDLQLALKWLVDNADLYGFDTTRINAWGYSSGAHLAALLASLEPGDPQSLEYTSELPRIKSVVAGGTPADLRKYSGSPIVMPFLGGDRHEIPQTYADASPAFHISADDPPVFLYHGIRDSLVEKEQARDYYHALLAAGVESELYLARWHGHMTMFLLGRDAEKKAIDFLNRKNT